MLEEKDSQHHPSAQPPVTSSGDQPAESRKRSLQIRVPRMEPQEYPRSRAMPQLILDTKLEDFLISDECQLRIQKQNEETLMLACAKDHCCGTNPSLRIMLRDQGEKPSEESLFFHLRMLHEVKGK